MKSKNLLTLVIITLMMATMLLAGCSQSGTPTQEPAPAGDTGATDPDTGSEQEAETADDSSAADPDTGSEQEAEPAGDAEPADRDTAGEDTADDKVGGTFVRPVAVEPNSLDPAAAGFVTIPQFLGSSLVTIAPDGTYVGYLAESWQVSEDATVYDFFLKQNVTFHNGMPLTAADYAFTFNRLIGPDAVPGGAAALLGPVISAEAVDDYTLRLTLAQPHAPLLFSLSITGFYQPVCQAAFEEMGAEAYGRSPVGVGPYKLQEWAVGDKIVLERNPDFAWGPDFVHDGAYYIETIEFPFVSESSTTLAALETGEVHFAEIPANELERFEAMGRFDFFQKLVPSFAPALQLNVGQAPFDDINVRQALNMAVNREGLAQVASMGTGIAQYGVFSPSTVGFWPEGEEYAKSLYAYDVEAAKALLAESGYADSDGDGIVEKDGQPLSISLTVTNERPEFVKVAEVLVEQYKLIGVEMVIQQIEQMTFSDLSLAGDYQAATIFMNYPEADGLYISFHSGMTGITNSTFANDPELDALLDETRKAADQVARQQAINSAQRLILDKAYFVPLYTTVSTYAMSNDIEGFLWADSISGIQSGYMNDAFFVK